MLEQTIRRDRIERGFKFLLRFIGSEERKRGQEKNERKTTQCFHPYALVALDERRKNSEDALAPRRTKRVSHESACAPQGYLFSNVGPAGGVFFLFSAIPSVFRNGWIDCCRPRNFSIEIGDIARVARLVNIVPQAHARLFVEETLFCFFKHCGHIGRNRVGPGITIIARRHNHSDVPSMRPTSCRPASAGRPG